MIKESEFQQLRKRLANNLRLLQGTKTSDEMANILCVSRGTYLSRLRNPEKLTVNEMSRLCRAFRIEPEKFLTETLKIG